MPKSIDFQGSLCDYVSVCYTNHTLLEQHWDESPESKNRSFLAAHSPGNLRPTVIQFHNKVLHFKFDKRLGKNPARSNMPTSSHDGLNFTAFFGTVDVFRGSQIWNIWVEEGLWSRRALHALHFAKAVLHGQDMWHLLVGSSPAAQGRTFELQSPRCCWDGVAWFAHVCTRKGLKYGHDTGMWDWLQEGILHIYHWSVSQFPICWCVKNPSHLLTTFCHSGLSPRPWSITRAYTTRTDADEKHSD